MNKFTIKLLIKKTLKLTTDFSKLKLIFLVEKISYKKFLYINS